MSVFDWSSAIKIVFDRPIVTETISVIDSESIVMLSGATVTVSSVKYGSVALLTDGLTSNSFSFTRDSLGWIKIAYNESVARHKFRLYSGSNYRPAGYTLDGSDNNSDWTAIASGTFANTTGWKEVIFDEISYRYWRITITSKHSSSYVFINEIELYGTKLIYDSSGWLVKGFEPAMSPSTNLIETTYGIRKITRADNNYAIIIWLDLNSRMKYPQGLVTVSFTGNLQGIGGAFVAPFTLSFTPQNITPIFNPNANEYIKAVDIKASLINIKKIFYTNYESNDMGKITITDIKILSAVLTHISDLEV